ncbi:hypothetical protein AB0G49_14240 [Streptomyces longwoodensis]|uniref:hypothetical protein n=1 Tax=Streptomyces longwoodensis TaxID=68231 RepID=UPI0033CEF6E2
MTAVPFAVDPVRAPLMVLRRPVSPYFRPLPPGAYESDARPVLASEVRAGDLVVGAFTEWPTPYGRTRSVSWLRNPYVAAPAPWNAACPCWDCKTLRNLRSPAPEGGRISMASYGTCDVWDASDYALIIPAAALLLLAAA